MEDTCCQSKVEVLGCTVAWMLTNDDELSVTRGGKPTIEMTGKTQPAGGGELIVTVTGGDNVGLTK